MWAVYMRLWRVHALLYDVLVLSPDGWYVCYAGSADTWNSQSREIAMKWSDANTRSGKVQTNGENYPPMVGVLSLGLW